MALQKPPRVRLVANCKVGAVAYRAYLLSVKLILRPFVLLFCWLVQTVGASLAQAQPQCNTVPQPPCTFQAFDAAAPPGSPELTAFCVGQPVRFEQCVGRNINPTLLFYGVLQGTGTTFISTSPACVPPNRYPFVYIPTPADVGMVTVSELATTNGQVGGGIPTYYIRPYRVHGTPPPAFTVAPCPSGLVSVTVTDAVYYRYEATVGTGPAQAISRIQPTSLPVPAGAANVTIRGFYNVPNFPCSGQNTLPIPTLAAPVTPQLNRLTLQGPLPGAATFDVAQLPAGYLYTLQLADAGAPGGFRDVGPVAAGSTSVALPSVALPNAAAGRYRLLRTDVCGSPTAASDTIGTLSLTGASAQNRNQLLLDDRGAPGTTYAVTRDGAALAAFRVIPGGLEDANVQCRTTYTYRVTAIQPGGGAAVSNPVAIRTVSALAPVQPRLLASFNLNNVVVLTPLLAAAPAPGGTLRYRRVAGSPAPANFEDEVIGLRPRRDSTALALFRAAPPCYSVRLTDVCGNAAAESASTCPALLTAAPQNPDGTAATLTWTAFTGPDPAQPAVYVLQRLGPDGAVLSSVPVSGGRYDDLLPPAERQILRYRLAISGAGLPAGIISYSNLATLARRPVLTVPNAFTPNGDGLNDVLEVKGRYLQDYLFVVVDRNGMEVFRGTKRADVWDGRIRGQAPVLGTYVWRFQQDSEDGERLRVSGTVTILQ